jgi:hypothetical protein
LCLACFILLATANSAGYRYGASDLAFYGPAVMRYLDRQLFPRDRPLIDAQAQLTFMDETVGTIARLTTDNFPVLLLTLYLVTLVLLAAGAAAIGATLYRSRWTTAALLAALTLRHAIAKSGTNTLEPYFHPRQLAFAFGIVAVAAFLRGRMLGTGFALAGAALLHPTTTLWFCLWLSVAAVVSERLWRPIIGIAAAGVTVVAVWALSIGPLAGRLLIMDDEWLGALAQKDYLFPLQWPASAWVLNAGYVAIIWLIYRQRAKTGVLVRRETGIVIGCLSLVAVFLTAAILNAARVALAIQLQPARIFWMLDFLAAVYIVWAIAGPADGSWRRPAIVAAALLVVATVRGAYVMRVEFPDRPLFEVRVPGDWGRVMAWAAGTSPDTGWLADPNHASRYGTSVRMAAGRDVFVEGIKDAAIGMYDRRVAMRTRDRLAAVDDFSRLSPDDARRLAARYTLDYLITEHDLALPLAFRSGALRVYELR